MLTLKDLCDMCDLTEEEIEAIAAHEQVPEAIAAEMGVTLLKDAKGRARIYRMICEDIQRAEQHDGGRRLQRYRTALRQFCRDYPDANNNRYRPPAE